MAEWITPKTDWYGNVDATTGLYVGDRFNASDFNRIKNNLTYLRDFATSLYNEFSIISVGNDKTPSDYLYADDINKIEKNIVTISQNTIKKSYGTTPTYYDNGHVMDFNELNRIEKATLDIYNNLINQYEGRRKFTFNFGMKEGL